MSLQVLLIFKMAKLTFDFTKKFSNGPGTTFQVKRASFDKVLADRAEELGVDIRYKHNVTACKKGDF